MVYLPKAQRLKLWGHHQYVNQVFVPQVVASISMYTVFRGVEQDLR